MHDDTHDDDTYDGDPFEGGPLDQDPDDDAVVEGSAFDDQEDTSSASGSAKKAGFDLLPSAGLLSFYDRLRRRVTDFLEERGGSLGQTASDYLLLVPDIFILLSRLALDKDVPKEQRALIGSALAYFVMPIDILPEVFMGPMGYLDDMVLTAAVLSRAFGDDLERFTDRHWSGSNKLRGVLTDLSSTAESLVGKNVYGKITALLRKKGIEVEESRSR